FEWLDFERAYPPEPEDRRTRGEYIKSEQPNL
ncbi:unnamed protein product, partial [Allacma fusca]